MSFVAFSSQQVSQPKATGATDTGFVQGSPDGRATEFQAAPEVEHYSGEKLLVGAYAALWLIMMVWLGLLWRKQATVASRLDGLEKAIDRAEKRLADNARSAAPKAKGSEATG